MNHQSTQYSHHLLPHRYTELSNHTLSGDALYDSPKFEKLREILPDLVDSGNHILVFSQWTRILDLLEVLMEDLDLPFLRLDGSTAVRERQALIDRFNSGAIPVFLLSTKAGGLGINLCQANYVIMHDLDFNPENDRQAEDRAHRIGQTREVHVLKLVTGDTVDEDIYAMGERKKRLSEAVLSNTAGARVGVGGGKGGAGDDGDGDIGAIGKILQRALIKKADRSIAAIAATATAAADGDGDGVSKTDTTTATAGAAGAAGAGDEHKEEQKEWETAVAGAVDLDAVAPPSQANKRDKKVAPKRVVNLLDSDSD
jgi:SWI/SNF-related matrix-associated actin-dependent regulator 1 of chromatin subfamily A